MALEAESVGSAVPEIPFVADLIVIVNSDLEVSRGLQQRLLAIGDAYLATALTVASIFAGVGFSGQKSWIVVVPVPLLFMLWYLDGSNWVHFQHASLRVRHLEALINAYVVAIREHKTIRPAAVKSLQRRIDTYSYDMESSIDQATWSEVWPINGRRLRWWLYPVIALTLALAGVLWHFA